MRVFSLVSTNSRGTPNKEEVKVGSSAWKTADGTEEGCWENGDPESSDHSCEQHNHILHNHILHNHTLHWCSTTQTCYTQWHSTQSVRPNHILHNHILRNHILDNHICICSLLSAIEKRRVIYKTIKLMTWLIMTVQQGNTCTVCCSFYLSTFEDRAPLFIEAQFSTTIHYLLWSFVQDACPNNPFPIESGIIFGVDLKYR